MSDLMDFLGNFNPDEHESMDFSPIPPGDYKVMIEKVEVKDTKSGTGKYINLQMAVIEGEYENRKIFDMINIQNPSDTCVKIGLARLADICRAIGVPTINDTDEMVNACLSVKVVVERKDKRVEDSEVTNKVGKYIAKDGTAPVNNTPSQPGAKQDVSKPSVNNTDVPWG